MQKNALILAGGKSQRFGEDKTLIKYGDHATITHFLFERLSEIFECVKVSAKNQKFNPPLPLLIDDFSEFCPLFVLANLDKTFNSPVFIIAADMPFVAKSTIETLLSNSHQICLAQDDENTHYLCGVFDPSVAKIARNLVQNGEKRIKSLVQICDTKIIKFDDSKQFLNINTKQDWEKVL